MLKRTVSIVSACVLLTSCSLDHQDIVQRKWKAGEGHWLGHDFIMFGGGYFSLRHDTIFVLDSAIAVIDDTERGYFGQDNEIRFYSLHAHERGVYHDFGPVKPEDTLVKFEIELTPPPPVEEPPVPPPPPCLSSIDPFSGK